MSNAKTTFENIYVSLKLTGNKKKICESQMYVQTHYYFKKVWELHIYDLMEITLYLLKIVI